LIVGAQEAQLPIEYREYLGDLPRYAPPSDAWKKLGASIFLGVFRPVWNLLDRITHSNTGKDGNVPPHIVWLVRSVIFVIWFIHDRVFAPLFGSGDGLDAGDQINEACADDIRELSKLCK
jgi:hypothetical protein